MADGLEEILSNVENSANSGKGKPTLPETNIAPENGWLE